MAYADSEAITVSTVAIGPTTANIASGPQEVSAAYGTVEGADIRLRFDGINPTSTEGHPVLAGGSFIVEGAGNVRALRMIRDSAATADATVFVTYEG